MILLKKPGSSMFPAEDTENQRNPRSKSASSAGNFFSN